MRLIPKGKEGNKIMANEKDREFGVSTEPGASYMDRVQESVQETGKGPEGEVMNVPVESGKASSVEESQSVEVDRDAVDVLEPQEVDREPKQVEEQKVVFVPKKDFSARINQVEHYFTKDVPVRITRNLANIVQEDETRGYVKD